MVRILPFLYVVKLLFIFGCGSSARKIASNPSGGTNPGGGRKDAFAIPPKISLINMSSPYFAEETYRQPTEPTTLLFQNESVYVAPSSRNYLVFECNASYPIRWNIGQMQVDFTVYHSMRVSSLRAFTDPLDPSTFTYVSLLSLDGPSAKLTGNYSCQSTARNYVQSSILVFWDSFFGTRFVNNNETHTVTIFSKDETFRLPCQVTEPHSRPTLQKLTSAKPDVFKGLQVNESISFSPAIGYILKGLPNPAGTYKCLLDGSEFVLIRVILRNATRKSYAFDYDDDKKQVKCCLPPGNGTVRKTPKLFMMECQHPSTCALRERISTDSIGYIWNQGRRSGDCSVLTLKSTHTGVVRCVGNGYTTYREFIAPLEANRIRYHDKRNSTTYFRWEEIDPQEMIAVSIIRQSAIPYDDPYWMIARAEQQPQKNEVIYSNQNVSLICHTSRYYFASGTYWMFRWKNKTMTRITGNSTRKGLRGAHLYLNRDRHLNMVSFIAHTDMEAAICFAPVWNSSVWVPKMYRLYINASTPPVIENSIEVVNYTWYANETEKRLTCSGKGHPAPTFQWMKENITILPTTHNYNVLETNSSGKAVEAGTTVSPQGAVEGTSPSILDDGTNSSSSSPLGTTANTTLVVARVSYSTGGVFRCIASNVGGTATKEFHIVVLEVKSWTMTGLLVGAVVITLGLIGGIALLLRRYYKDRQNINQLVHTSSLSRSSTVSFNDAMSSGSANGDISTTSQSKGFSGTEVSSPHLGWHDDSTNSHSRSYVNNGFQTNNLIDAF